MPRLTKEEQEFLLGGPLTGGSPPRTSPVTLMALEAVLHLMPRKTLGFIVLFVTLTILPALGLGTSLTWLGLAWTATITLATSCAGIALLARHAKNFVTDLLGSLRRGEVPRLTCMREGVLSAAGFFLMLPGPILNACALLLLLPRVTRLTGLALRRWIWPAPPENNGNTPANPDPPE